MAVEGLDHLAITVADVGATIGWYERVCGAVLEYADRWRSGQMPVAILQIGASRLSVHPAAAPASPHALAPTPGSADVCFRWRGPVEGIVEHLREAGVVVVEGPVPRPASDGTRGTSVYIRDPDGNLIEFLTIG